MPRHLLLLSSLLSVCCLFGCGSLDRAAAPLDEESTDGVGLVARAANPNTLRAVQLTPPQASPLTFTAFYGSPLVRLGYVPANSKWANKIAFDSDRDGNQEVYVMNADGSNPIRLTNNSAHDSSPVWSLDGTKIAFFSERDGNREVYRMNAEGSNPVNLTNNSAQDHTPAWSPDGTKIAFTSERDGNGEIYLINSDGSNLVRLTNNPTADEYPDWSPVREGRRWLVGANRTDRGFDPPFGAEADGAILVWRESGCVDAVDVDVQTVKSLRIVGAAQGAGEEVVLAEVLADKVVRIREDRGPGSPPLVLIGPAADNPVYDYGTATVVKALVGFSARTGRVVTVIPLTNKSRAAGPEYSVEQAGQRGVLRGDFAAVVDAAAAVNRAPGGAAEVVLDAGTGEVLTVRQEGV